MAASCLTLVLLASQAGHAQDAPQVPSPPFACGVAAVGAEAEAYFLDLCRAMAVAVHGDDEALAARVMSADEAAGALAAHEIPIVVGLPYELRADVAVGFGPVVLIRDDARYALAHAPGSQREGDLAAWLFFALVQAEAHGVDSAALDEGLPGDTRDMFLAYEQRLTSQLVLDENAIRRMVASVGSHGEIYARHFAGEAGPNRPVELGGQLYAPPVSDR